MIPWNVLHTYCVTKLENNNNAIKLTCGGWCILRVVYTYNRVMRIMASCCPWESKMFYAKQRINYSMELTKNLFLPNTDIQRAFGRTETQEKGGCNEKSNWNNNIIIINPSWSKSAEMWAVWCHMYRSGCLCCSYPRS